MKKPEYVNSLVKVLHKQHPHVPEKCLIELATAEFELFKLNISTLGYSLLEAKKLYSLPCWISLAYEQLGDKSIQWDKV